MMTPVNGAEAGGQPPPPGGEQRVQERRVRSQRHRNYMSRTHLHTPPDLPEGYGKWWEGPESGPTYLVISGQSSATFVGVAMTLFLYFSCFRATDDPAGSNLLPAHTDRSQYVARSSSTQVRPAFN